MSSLLSLITDIKTNIFGLRPTRKIAKITPIYDISIYDTTNYDRPIYNTPTPGFQCATGFQGDPDTPTHDTNYISKLDDINTNFSKPINYDIEKAESSIIYEEYDDSKNIENYVLFIDIIGLFSNTNSKKFR